MICRLCLNNLEPYDDDAFELFNIQSNEETMFTKFIVKYLHVELSKEEKISDKICASCGSKLTNFDEFYKLVEEKQHILRNNIQHNDGKADELHIVKKKLQATENGVFLPENESHTLDLIKDELPLCEAILSNRSTPCSEFGEAQSVSSSVNLKEKGGRYSSQINAETVEGEERKRHLSIDDECSSKDSCSDSMGSSDDDDLPLNSLLCKKLEKSNIHIRKHKTKSNEGGKGANEKSAKKKLTEDDIINEELIARFLSVRCELCDLVETSFSDLKRHYRAKHGCKGYLKCCGVRFKERYRLATHIKTHVNPYAYKCSICAKILKSKEYLQRHMEDKHSKDEEMIYQCDICGKRFANKNTAYRHKKVHNERTFKCELCNKSFKNKYVLEGHTQRLHGTFQNAFMCDICGREYRFKPSFEKHVAEHKGIVLDTSKQCDVCGEWYNKYDRHMDKHNHVDIKCNICGKETSSKAALRSHIDRVHKKRNRADTNAACTFCGKAFKYKKNLQEHITLHTDEKLYNCKFCDREFRSSANMYAHTKRAHTEQWLQAKLIRNSKAPPHLMQQT